jgi:hypothetical protein
MTNESPNPIFSAEASASAQAAADETANSRAPVLHPDMAYAFTPVPVERRRADGWSPVQQARFIQALAAMGSVGQAAKAVGINRASAYKLRERAGAESFAAAWDIAMDIGRQWQFSVALERAIDGVTTVRVLRGGSVDVTHGCDMRIANEAMRGL